MIKTKSTISIDNVNRLACLSCIEQTYGTCPSKLKANNLYLKRTNFILFALNELIGKRILMINILKRLNLIYDNFLLNKPMILNAEFENGYTVMKANALYFLARPLNKGGGGL